MGQKNIAIILISFLLFILNISCYAELSHTNSEIKQNNKIDKLVFSKLKDLDIPPSDQCTDEVFLRRIYFDVIGTLPTVKEVRSFSNNKDQNKCSQLIDHLLERDEFADYWSLKWCDILRVKSEFPSNLWPNAVQGYHRWIKTSIKENMPYDQFARILLTSSGSNFREFPVNFYRALPNKKPQTISNIVALTFMGVRTTNWTPEMQTGMAAFFTKVGYKSTMEWKEEIVFFDENGEYEDPETGKTIEPIFPDGKQISINPEQDPREVFADWLISPENPYFSKNIVNRIWYWLLGRGIIHEPDNIHKNNLPQNPDLLKYLEKELITNNFDLKHIYRLILNSQVYQLSSIPNKKNQDDYTNFSHYYVRQLNAEVLIDAICQITWSKELYHSKIPEPFTFIPPNQRSITLADGSITSPFLETFGRPPRDTGFESERNNNPTTSQRLHFLNSTHFQKKFIKSKGLKKLSNQSKKDGIIIDRLYLTILSRHPVSSERKIAKEYLNNTKNKKDAVCDLAWALINTKEFCFHH